MVPRSKRSPLSCTRFCSARVVVQPHGAGIVRSRTSRRDRRGRSAARSPMPRLPGSSGSCSSASSAPVLADTNDVVDRASADACGRRRRTPRSRERDAMVIGRRARNAREQCRCRSSFGKSSAACRSGRTSWSAAAVRRSRAAGSPSTTRRCESSPAAPQFTSLAC